MAGIAVVDCRYLMEYTVHQLRPLKYFFLSFLSDTLVQVSLSTTSLSVHGQARSADKHLRKRREKKRKRELSMGLLPFQWKKNYEPRETAVLNVTRGVVFWWSNETCKKRKIRPCVRCWILLLLLLLLLFVALLKKKQQH